MICYLFSEPIYLLFSPDVPQLLYYSHIPTAIITILVGFFVLWSGKKLLLNQLLFAISISFSLWVLSNLVLWTNIHSDTMLFIWSFLRVLSSLISILSIYFIYVFLEKKDVSLLIKSIFLILIIPVILLAPTYLNLSGFNLSSCDGFMFEGLLFQFYRIAFGILAMIWILILLIRKYRTANINFKKEILLMGIGIELFLFVFFLVTFLAAYFTKIGLLPDSRIEYYGLFGMDIFIIYLSIVIIRFKVFNIKLIATQALVWGLTALIGSQFFFIKSQVNFILNGFGFGAVIVLGQILVKSVKKEIYQKEKLGKLSEQLSASKNRLEDTNLKLENANDKLKDLDRLKTEFLSLASHQLRSPLTAIKGYTSMLVEGDFGKLDEKVSEVVRRVFESTNNLTLVVEDLLDVAKIEQGGMKYTKENFDFTEVVKFTTEELSVTAKQKGLIMNFNSDNKSHIIFGDKEKLRQVVLNLIDNSIKYTPKGHIDVSISSSDGKVLMTIKDTGVGIKPEVKDSLFQKFNRGEGAKVNTGGSGLGLYLAREIARAHSGKIWAESEGEGKGSSFFLELSRIEN